MAETARSFKISTPKSEIAWRTTAGGHVRRLGDSSDQAGAVTSLAIAPALRRPSGQLLVISSDDRSTSGEV